MNTGAVGGPPEDSRAKKVRIGHSSSVLEGIVSGTILWEPDPDFGYEVASSMPGLDDHELLRPRALYERQGRVDEYNAIVENLKVERRAYLRGFPGLASEVVESI